MLQERERWGEGGREGERDRERMIVKVWSCGSSTPGCTYSLSIHLLCVIIIVNVHQVHTFTQELNLSYGELDPESALQVVEALSNKKEIEKIELNGQI